MEDLIDDLLVYSRVSQGERDGQASAVPLGEVIAAALRSLDAAIAESGIRISVGDLPVVTGHRTQLTQLFQNLINNAIKYRRSESPLVEIDARPTPTGWDVSVTDNGIGIPSQYHETIFGLFKRLHSRSVPGTGIGLALCRRIAEAHGGAVRVDSAPGRGSTFHVILADGAGQASPAAQ
jgi:light-regulated signal transduction histidine kinase (bacteriophytochrome)